MELQLEVNKYLDFLIGFLTATGFYLITLGKRCTSSGYLGNPESVESTCTYTGPIIDLLSPNQVALVLVVLLVFVAARVFIWYRDSEE